MLELLEQGVSAGMYAQSLRDILRKMSRDNSDLQLKSIQQILDLGDKIANAEQITLHNQEHAHLLKNNAMWNANNCVSPRFQSSIARQQQQRNNSPSRKNINNQYDDVPRYQENRASILRSRYLSPNRRKKYQSRQQEPEIWILGNEEPIVRQASRQIPGTTPSSHRDRHQRKAFS